MGGMVFLGTKRDLCTRYWGLRNRIREETHSSRYSIRLGSTKMYHDLREIYWWDGLKGDIEEFVARCPNCQQVKDEHLKPSGLTQIMDVPTGSKNPSIWISLLGWLEPVGKMSEYGLLWISWPNLPTLFLLSLVTRLKTLKGSTLIRLWVIIGFKHMFKPNVPFRHFRTG